MASYSLKILIALMIIAEMGVLVTAGFVLFRKWGATFAEAAAYGLVTALMLLSFGIQVAFLTGFPLVSLFFEIGALGVLRTRIPGLG